MTSPAPPRDLRARIESGFVAWAHIATRHRWPVVIAGLAVALGFASQIPSLTVNNSTDAFLAADDPIRVEYDQFREQFGLDTRITIAIESDAIFSLEFLEKLRQLHTALEEAVPHLDEITSLINARDTHGEGDTLVVGDLLEVWPESEAELAELRERVLANPLYRDTLISQDGTLTTVSIVLDAFASDEAAFDVLDGFGDDATEDLTLATPSGSIYLPVVEQERAVGIAREVAAPFMAPDFRMYMGGSPVLMQTLNQIMIADVVRSAAGCLIMVGIFLALLFRRPAAVLLPLFVIVASLTTTLGVVAISGYAIGFGTQILPSFLMAVGVCDSVHILAIYYIARQAGTGKEEAIAYALGHSSLPVLMTSLTTAGGLASFVSADLAPIQELGIFAPIGVMFAFVYTIFLMPALMAIAPMGSPSARPATDQSWLDRTLRATGAWSARHRLAVLTGTFAIVGFSLVGASFIHMSHDPMEWLPETDEFREATLLLNRRLGGVNSLEVIVGFEEENAIHEPAVLAGMQEFEKFASRYVSGPVHVGQTISILDVLRETHQALNENDSAFYVVPQERKLVAQELLLFENSGTDDLEELVDTRFAMARMSLRVPWVDTLHYPAVVEEITMQVNDTIGGEAEIQVTGLVAMLSRTFSTVFSSMIRSYAIAILVIVPMMMLLLGSVRMGLLSMIPNLTPIIMLLGYMGWTETVVDGMTIIVGAIVLGLAVDDTIHYMHNFRRSYVSHGNSLRAIDDTLRGTGRALLVTSLVLTAGFSVFLMAYMSNVQNFGLLTGGTILMAFVSNIVVGSALMSYASEWGLGRAGATERGATELVQSEA
jgi:predicted RND superfamily exporter protein